jgi:hypothetical protein
MAAAGAPADDTLSLYRETRWAFIYSGEDLDESA